MIGTAARHGSVVALLVIALGAFALLSPGRAAAADADVTVANYYYCNSSYEFGVCPTNVSVGDTVTWHFSGVYHSTTECGGASCDDPAPPTPLFDSGLHLGGTYAYTFTTAGTYLYQCSVHGAQMRGQIVVGAAVGGIAELSGGDGAPLAQPGSGESGRTIGAALLAAALATAGVAASAAWYARGRWLG